MMPMEMDISPYREDWPATYEEERLQLTALLEKLQPQIEHIGSTAVQGLGAKPIIDILIGLSEESTQWKDATKVLLNAGYCYFPCYEQSAPGRRFFARLKGLASATFEEAALLPDHNHHPRTHHLHIVSYGSALWQRHLAFRDYLRTHPMARDAYHRMKLKLAAGTWETGDDYAQVKAQFIKRMEWLM
jgi:GrpB-like predicted nucleotidyltransferase (UPF0157 family)